MAIEQTNAASSAHHAAHIAFKITKMYKYLRQEDKRVLNLKYDLFTSRWPILWFYDEHSNPHSC